MKKTVSLIAALIIILTSFSFAVSAAGSSMDTATPISFGKSYSGVMVVSGADYYKINLSSSGKITVSLNGNLGAIYFYLYDASGSEIDSFYDVKDSNSDTLKWKKSYDLVSGDYYIVFSERSNKTGDYRFDVSFSSAQESFSENQENKDNSLERSNELAFSNTYRGQIAKNDGSDYYKINLTSSGKITVSLNGNLDAIYFYLYNASGSEIDSFYEVKDSNSDTLKWKKSYDLVSGDYYIVFSERSNKTGDYRFDVGFSSAQETFGENQENKNNSLERSNKIAFSNTYRGQIAKNDGSDYYKINLTSSGKITVSLNGNLDAIYFYLYNASGSEIDSFYDVKDSNSDTLKWKKSYDLVSGDYYIVFSERSNKTGSYSFSVSEGSNTPTQSPTERPTQSPTTRPADKPSTTRPAEVNTTARPVDKPSTTRPAEVNTTQKKAEKTTQAPATVPEYNKPETYVEPENNSKIDIYVDIDFEYTIINNYVVILKYTGNDSDVVVPEKIDGYEVKGIGDNAFSDTGVVSVHIPDCVTKFGTNAFGEEKGQQIQLYCSEGSAAQSYADEKGIGYELNMVDYSGDGSSAVSDGLNIKTIVVIVVVAVLAIGAVIVFITIGMKKTLI